MFPERVIPAAQAQATPVEGFPYFAANFHVALEPVSQEDDQPVAARLSTPEEDAKRLASVDQVIFEKLQAAEREAENVARRAYEEGFASGEAEGRAFGESQHVAYNKRLNDHLRELSQAISIAERASRDEVLALALAFGEYLAGQQIEHVTQAIPALLKTVLEANPFPLADSGRLEEGGLVVLMNPKDLEGLGGATFPGVRIAEDPALSRGSLRLESAEGVMEATLERRRERLLQLIHRLQETDQT